MYQAHPSALAPMIATTAITIDKIASLRMAMPTRVAGREARPPENQTIFARAISGRFFASSNEEGGNNSDGVEVSRVYPFPAPIETVTELRTRLTLAEQRLAELKAILEDMRRDRDAWREQAQTRLLPAPAAPMSWWRWLRTTG